MALLDLQMKEARGKTRSGGGGGGGAAAAGDPMSAVQMLREGLMSHELPKPLILDFKPRLSRDWALRGVYLGVHAVVFALLLPYLWPMLAGALAFVDGSGGDGVGAAPASSRTTVVRPRRVRLDLMEWLKPMATDPADLTPPSSAPLAGNDGAGYAVDVPFFLVAWSVLIADLLSIGRVWVGVLAGSALHLHKARVHLPYPDPDPDPRLLQRQKQKVPRGVTDGSLPGTGPVNGPVTDPTAIRSVVDWSCQEYSAWLRSAHIEIRRDPGGPPVVIRLDRVLSVQLMAGSPCSQGNASPFSRLAAVVSLILLYACVLASSLPFGVLALALLDGRLATPGTTWGRAEPWSPLQMVPVVLSIVSFSRACFSPLFFVNCFKVWWLLVRTQLGCCSRTQCRRLVSARRRGVVPARCNGCNPFRGVLRTAPACSSGVTSPSAIKARRASHGADDDNDDDAAAAAASCALTVCGGRCLSTGLACLLFVSLPLWVALAVLAFAIPSGLSARLQYLLLQAQGHKLALPIVFVCLAGVPVIAGCVAGAAISAELTTSLSLVSLNLRKGWLQRTAQVSQDPADAPSSASSSVVSPGAASVLIRVSISSGAGIGGGCMGRCTCNCHCAGVACRKQHFYEDRNPSCRCNPCHALSLPLVRRIELHGYRRAHQLVDLLDPASMRERMAVMRADVQRRRRIGLQLSLGAALGGAPPKA